MSVPPWRARKLLSILTVSNGRLRNSAEGGGAGAEIVDRKARARRRGCAPACRHSLASSAMALSVISRLSVPGAMPLPVSTGLEQVLEAGVAQLPARKIDADEQGRRQREITLPMGQIAGRAFQREPAQRHDQAGLFGMGDEIGRRDQALDRMLPAQQRLEPRHAAVGQPHDGLIEDVELAVVQRVAQIGFPAPRRRRGAIGFQLADIDPGAGAALPLGGDQRQLGILDQRAAGPRSARRREPTLAGAKISAAFIGDAAGCTASTSASPSACGARRGLANSKRKAVAADAENLRLARRSAASAARASLLQHRHRRRHRPGWREWP